ncbi:hypothetical protein BC938DRAFT_476743 [Jimgerdemannia flammicorona]|uniref:Helicase ATP-binding domain-containing protein n=1 Tax=Jimgerdemannia flammicorona TaxID=994334 RepID=A0A433QQ90_9FUNG|nr:hypothetical protein BC938DRAFT_476743 [Jimgerdemannia flammicorona]
MPHYTIRGITVNFPYEAYGIQKIFMEKVIHSLQSKQNGLLESPTGTGKTLTLLCAVLAWREAWQARRQLDRGIYNQDVAELDAAISTSPSLGLGVCCYLPNFAEDFIGIDAPKIIYASRTHSQLAQTVSELKNTAYKYASNHFHLLDALACPTSLQESSCGEATSFEITPTDLANSIREAQICRDYALKPGYFGEYDENAFEILKVALEAEIDKLEIPSSTQELIKPGDFMYELLNRIKINSDTFEHLQRVMDTAVNMLATIGRQSRIACWGRSNIGFLSNMPFYLFYKFCDGRVRRRQTPSQVRVEPYIVGAQDGVSNRFLPSW